MNKSLSPSNDLVVVSGVLTNTGTGTLTVANLGPTLAVGDKFTLFSQPVQNGAALTVTGGGATWTNNLAVDGSITVASVLVVTPPTLNFTNTRQQPAILLDHGGFKLQAQTNSINVGISTNWANYPGGGTSPVTVPIDVTNGTVFFRLARHALATASSGSGKSVQPTLSGDRSRQDRSAGQDGAPGPQTPRLIAPIPPDPTASNLPSFGLLRSRTPSNRPSLINGATISEFEAESQTMWPGNWWTFGTSTVSRRRRCGAAFFGYVCHGLHSGGIWLRLLRASMTGLGGNEPPAKPALL